jgi:cytoskeleton protein RodZ
MLAQDKTFCLGVPGTTATMEVSAEALRSILGQVEAELYRSEVYRRAVTNLQQTPTEGGASAQFLLKAVGREAIRLALRHLIRQQAQNTQVSPVPPTPPEALSTVVAPTVEAIASIEPALPAPSEAIAHPPKAPRLPLLNAIAQFKPQKRLSAAELAELAEQTRQQTLRNLGTQIRLAREARSVSIEALHLKSLVPLYHLKAWENGDIDHLPDIIFLKGFLCRIAPVLGLNHENLIAALPPHDPKAYALPTWKDISASQRQSKGGLKDLTGQPLPLYVGYAALMVGGCVWLSQQSAPKTTLPPIEIDKPQVKQPTAPKATAASHPANSPTKLSKQVAPPETLRF